MRNTPETWIVAAVMAAAAITWVALTVTRSHHTSVVPPTDGTTLATAAPRFGTPAP